MKTDEMMDGGLARFAARGVNESAQVMAALTGGNPAGFAQTLMQEEAMKGAGLIRLWRDGVEPCHRAHCSLQSHNFGNHSPDGVNWGYAGSGPAALAGDLLLGCGFNRNQTRKMYHDLKFALVSKLPVAVPDDEIVLAVLEIPFWNPGVPTRKPGWTVCAGTPPPGSSVFGGSIYIRPLDILGWAQVAHACLPMPPKPCLLVVFTEDEKEARACAREKQDLCKEDDFASLVEFVGESCAGAAFVVGVGDEDQNEREFAAVEPINIPTLCPACGKKDGWEGDMEGDVDRGIMVKCKCGAQLRMAFTSPPR